MENPNEPKKSKFSEQPHYFQWGLTAFCVIGCCVLVAFVLIKLPFIWNVVKKLFGALSPFIYGFVMAYLLMPVFNMLTGASSRRCRENSPTERASPRASAVC